MDRHAQRLARIATIRERLAILRDTYSAVHREALPALENRNYNQLLRLSEQEFKILEEYGTLAESMTRLVEPRRRPRVLPSEWLTASALRDWELTRRVR